MKSPETNAKTSILLVDDDKLLLHSMGEWLSKDIGFTVAMANSVATAEAELKKRSFDLAIVDLRLGNEDGFDVLRCCREKYPNTTVMLMTGYATIDTGVEAIRAGAFDLLTKPLIDEELLMSIERAISQRHYIEENKRLKTQLDERFGMENIIGTDPKMQKTFDVVESIADTKATVLITGQSGTGKSLIARAIHQRSDRRDKPFIEIACGALPENLLESELFGHVAGSFTGASQDKIGKFKQADGGTIFLDEIGTASPGLQVKLLRVLQELEFEQVGGTKTFKVDTRVILATNEDLAANVADGSFRQDLYYRINVINIQLPSLSQRPTDVSTLAHHFLQKFSDESGRQVEGFEPAAVIALQQYSWPGNVRELQNVIERAVLLGKGSHISVADLPNTMTSGVPMMPTATSAASAPRQGRQTLKEALEGPERQIILQVLKENNWNRNETADQLGINRTTLYKKMRKLNLDKVGAEAPQS